jgi:hypothetical protein
MGIKTKGPEEKKYNSQHLLAESLAMLMLLKASMKNNGCFDE